MNSEFTIAVHSLVLLLYRPDHMATSEEIAANVCTHPARVRKVMSLLRKQGYVATKEGSGGGYRLSCDLEHVTLAEVYRVVALGTMKPSWCSGDPDQACMVASNIRHVMDDIFADAEAQLLRHLELTSLQQVLERLRAMKQGTSTCNATPTATED